MKRFISLLLSVCMVCSIVLPVWAEAPTASGTCGASVTWEFDEATGTLTISGTGEMDNYRGEDVAPWQDERANIKKVIVDEGVTYISINAFSECPNLTEAVLPETLEAIGHMAFWRCESLEQISFPDGLEFIGNWAFSDSAITELVFPASVNVIGAGAFFDCRSLTTVTFAPDSELTELASQLFGGCSQLTTVELPDGLKKIGEGAFGSGEDPDQNYYTCENLTAIALPDGLERIEEFAFGESGLTSITIPGSVEYIGDTVFYECKALESAVLEEGVKEVGESIFNGCTALTDVTLPSTLEIISDNAFFGCESLTEIVIPEGATTIGSSAFNSCTSLKSVEIPSTVTSIGNAAFYPGEDSEGNERKTSIENIVYHGPREQWKAFAEQEGGIGIGEDDATMTYEEDDVVWSYDSATGTLTIDGNDAIQDYGNTNNAPWNEYSQEVTKVVIGDGVTAIGQNSFENYPDLEAVEIGSGVTRIGNGAFATSKKLTSVTIPENVKEVGDWAFGNGEGLKEVVFEGVETIGASAFNGCTALETVEFPATLQSIGDDAFFECKSLTELVLPEGVTTIGSGAFNSCTSLKSVEIPSSVEAIGDAAFFRGNGNQNTSIEEILYHGSKESWKKLADNGMNIGVDWDEVTMTYEEDGVFWSFDKETATLTISGEGAMADYDDPNDAPWREYCAEAVTIKIDSGITHVADNAFERFEKLETVELSDTVASIGEGTFANCYELTEIELPASLTEIGDRAFDNGDEGTTAFLTKVTYHGNAEQWANVTKGESWCGDADVDEIVEYKPDPAPVDPTPTPAPSTGGGSGDDGSAAILLVGGAAAAAAGVYLYTHPDVLPAAIEKVKGFAADVSECVQSKMQALSDGIQGMGQRWLPVADDEDEQEAQEQPAA